MEIIFFFFFFGGEGGGAGKGIDNSSYPHRECIFTGAATKDARV